MPTTTYTKPITTYTKRTHISMRSIEQFIIHNYINDVKTYIKRTGAKEVKIIDTQGDLFAALKAGTVDVVFAWSLDDYRPDHPDKKEHCFYMFYAYHII